MLTTTPSISQHTYVSERGLSLPYSYSKVEDDVPVAIDLDNVFKFCIGDYRHGSLERLSKVQRQTYASLSHETEVIVLAEVSRQIECV